MAVAFETNTTETIEAPSASPESHHESEVLQWSSNYDYLKSLDNPEVSIYEEAVVLRNPDGSVTTYLAKMPIDLPPEATPTTASEGYEGDIRTQETGWMFDQTDFLRATSNPIAKAALENFGYSASRQENFLEATFPSKVQVNATLEYLESQTGFAPRLEDFEGDYFPGNTMIENIDGATILAGTELRVRSHDMFNHNTAWYFLPQQTFRMNGERGKLLQDEFNVLEEQGAQEKYAVRLAIKKHLTTLEREVDIRMFEQAAALAADPNLSTRLLDEQLYEVTYGEMAEGDEIKLAVGHQLALEMANRIRIAAEMPAAT